MTKRLMLAFAAALLIWTPAGAEEDPEFERIELRVVSVGPGSAIQVDRGARDGMAVGDVVNLYPKKGGVFGATVVQVGDRIAVVEPDDKTFRPEPGTRGEILVPVSRFAEPEPEPEAEPEKAPVDGDAPDHPGYENEDEGYTKDKPLLADVRPVRPKERARRLTGRAYAGGALTENPSGDFDNSSLRAGIDAYLENYFERGERVHVNAEINHRTVEPDNDTLTEIILRRLSYATGGTRFEDTRWEAGRFLQYGMPEFGVLDGFEWTRRRSDGARYGFSLGYLPELNETFDSFRDFQVAGYFEWTPDEKEQLTLTAGFQKSWHNGAPDRDLFIGKARWLPPQGWQFHGTVWVDFYTGGDDIKGSGLEVTQALATATKRYESGHRIDVVYTRIRFPEMDRNEFLPLLDAEIANNRLDRLSVRGWLHLTRELAFHADVTGFDDEDGAGGSAELGVEWNDPIGLGHYADVTAFFTAGQFEDVIGARAAFGKHKDRWRWDVFYEFSAHDFEGFPSDTDDLIQHRLRVSGAVYVATGWDFSVYGEGVLWDDELSWTLGFFVQKRF